MHTGFACLGVKCTKYSYYVIINYHNLLRESQDHEGLKEFRDVQDIQEIEEERVYLVPVDLKVTQVKLDVT